MNLELQIILWSLLFCLAVAYAWWVRMRVTILREDLFEVRDRLWDQMRTQGKLDHLAHLQAREAINAAIRFAPRLNTSSFFVIISQPKQTQPKTQWRDLPETEQAVLETGLLATKYVFFKTLSGFVMLILFSLFSLGHLAVRGLAKWFNESFVESASELNALPTS